MLATKAERALEYIDGLLADQKKVLLGGTFEQIGEYKAACTNIRTLERQRTRIAEIFNEEADDE